MAALVLALAGCVTPQSMRARAPDFTATSSKSVTEIAGCIGSSWRGPALASSPITGGVSLSETVGEDVDVMLEIKNEGQARSLAVYFRHYPISFLDTAGITARAKACL